MEAAEQNVGPWCMACGYCLHGLPQTAAVCPECGGNLAEVAGRLPPGEFKRRLWISRAIPLVTSFFAAIVFLCTAAPFIRTWQTYSVGSSSAPGGSVSHTISFHSKQLMIGRTLKIALMHFDSVGELKIDSRGEWLVIECDAGTGTCICRNSAGETWSAGQFSSDMILEWLRRTHSVPDPRDAQSRAVWVSRNFARVAGMALATPADASSNPDAPVVFAGRAALRSGTYTKGYVSWPAVATSTVIGLIAWAYVSRIARWRLHNDLRIPRDAGLGPPLPSETRT